MRTSILCLLLLLTAPAAKAQKVLQIEKYGKAKTEKIFIGQEITYKLKGNDFYHTAVIEDLLVDKNIIVLGDRYTSLANIEALRYNRSWVRPISTSVFWFGTAWSAFAAIGTLTDGDPTTKYRASDAVVTGTSWLLSWSIARIFKNKTVKLGKKKRLRMLDISFKKRTWP